ncbi:Na(+)/citrate cotransporter-like [Symsagittifera roscoffensis]|uniref:Na(+)/citrate cotransporter-like n=1 Tax=Symsagittifera roscoffensis TaxID=84072 RepID=UPI00307B3667
MMSFIKKNKEFSILIFNVLSVITVIISGLATPHLEIRCGLVVLLMSCLWMFELLPLPLTAMLPLVLFPVLEISDAKIVATQYLKDTTVLLFGGLMFAVSIEHWNVHKRIALATLSVFGGHKGMVLMSFMLIGWFLSMWISNTATTSMLVPIAAAVANELDPKNQKKKMTKNKEKQGLNLDTSEHEQPEKKRVQYDRHSDVIVINGEVGELAAGNLDEVTETTIDSHDAKDSEFLKFKRGLMLGVAYSCSIGGTATITGTAPNALLLGNIEDFYGKTTGFNFGTFMMYSFPESLICLFVAWTLLYTVQMHNFTKANSTDLELNTQLELKVGSPEGHERSFKEVINEHYRDLGCWKPAEKIVTVAFVTLALLWIFRSPKCIPGWADLLGLSKISDASVVMVIVFVLFASPSFSQNKSEDKTILTWDTVQKKMSWSVLFLIGGGFAMASGVQSSGLDTVVMNALKHLDGIPPFFLLLIIVCVVGFLTEFTSNTSTASIVQPIMSSLSGALGVNPLLLMVPTTVACSFAFCFPVATPPNAIVFSEGTLRVRDMVKCGFLLNILCFTVATCWAFTWGNVVFSMHQPLETS